MHNYKRKNLYLIAYGAISTLCWFATLISTIRRTLKKHNELEFNTTNILLLQISQSLSIFDILNSLFGLTRSQLLPTLIQVSSRLHIVWIVFYLSPKNSHQITTVFVDIMIIVWCLAELIRYPYYVVLELSILLSSIKMPLFLKWLRYSAFAILYPIGILSELVICSNFISDIYNNIGSSDPIYTKLLHFPSAMPNKLNFEVNLACLYIVIICLYIPGSLFMYIYMLKQRKKSLINLWKTESEHNLKVE